MVLFDWPTKKKVQDRLNAEWQDWLRRRDEAHARGEDFNEPSPAERAKKSQVA